MSRFRLSAAAAALAIVAILSVPTAASAHDEIIGSTPADASVLDVAPRTVDLEFSAEILSVGAEIRVIAADANVSDPEVVNYATGEIVVDGTIASIAVDQAIPAGSYQALWRVVSGDGHPIEGVVAFTLAGDPSPAPAQTSEAPAPETSEAPVATEPAATTPAPASEDGDQGRTLVIAGVGVVAALALVLAIVALRRRSAAKKSDTTR